MGPDEVHAVTRRTAVASAIRRRILNGSTLAGTRLKEHELAAALGVSRTTVREALRELVFEGILVDEPYKGLRVAEVSGAALLDVATVRVALETIAASRLSQRLTPDLERTLGTSLAALEAAQVANDAERLYTEHSNFHQLIYECSGMVILQRIWPLFDAQSLIGMGTDRLGGTDFEQVVANHRRFFDTIRSGEPAAINAHVEEHVLSATRHRLRQLGESGTPSQPSTRSSQEAAI